MKIAIVIPARYESTRFPGKPLVLIGGKPMILRTAERASAAYGKDAVWVATDSEEIEELCRAEGFQVVITDSGCLTGTDRVAEAAKYIDADIFVNVQGDEPLVEPEDIRKVVEAKREDPDAIINAMAPLLPSEDPDSPHIPKVLVNERGRLIYMSRLPIPGSKQPQAKQFYKQICIYAFSRNELAQYHESGRKSLLEKQEDIEILRFLEFDATIKMVMLTTESIAVDVPEDIIKVEEFIKCKNTSDTPSPDLLSQF